jgi:plexin A
MFIYHSLFQVEVGMGKLRYVIGKLSYASPAGLNGPLSKPALIGIVAGIVVLFLIFVAFLIAYRRKSTESNRVLKNMQEQMDILELRVAAECKEGEKDLVLFINITSIMLLPALWNTDKLAVVILI